jgi:hypothetical protein
MHICPPRQYDLRGRARKSGAAMPGICSQGPLIEEQGMRYLAEIDAHRALIPLAKQLRAPIASRWGRGPAIVSFSRVFDGGQRVRSFTIDGGHTIDGGQVFHYHISHDILPSSWQDHSDSNSPVPSITSLRAATGARTSTSTYRVRSFIITSLMISSLHHGKTTQTRTRRCPLSRHLAR